MFKLKHIETNEVIEFSMTEMLDYINADRNPKWIDYDETDVIEGWYAFCEGDSYTLVEVNDEPPVVPEFYEKK
jgi:hypothetical protein